MTKHSVNLIIKKDDDSLLIKRLKKYLPLTSGISFLIFIIATVVTYIFLNGNIAEYNSLKREVTVLEERIKSQQQNEDIYISTGKTLTGNEKILFLSINFNPVLSEVINLPTEGITIPNASCDKLGNLSFKMVASSSSKLDNFITHLLNKETKSKLYSNMKAGGIVRNEKGNYSMSISLNVDKTLLK